MAQPYAAPASDPSGKGPDRSNPRASATGFLEACENADYQRAAQYLDLRQLPATSRAARGAELAKGLEAILNADSQFNVLRLDRHPEGDLTDDPDPNREHAATVTQNGRNLVLDLERVTLEPGQPHVWLFSHDTVAAIPKLRPSAVPPALERYLPSFLVSLEILETPLWKWLTLIAFTALIVSLSRLLDRLLALVMTQRARRVELRRPMPWLTAVIQPLRVVLGLAVLRIGIEIVDPSAIARLYIGRVISIAFVSSIAWCLIRLVELVMTQLERRLDANQQLASRSMLRLGRRGATVAIVVFTSLLLLQNWGYNMSTFIAGLGVGGIAVALAAQQTIANVFGGVSLVGDHPVRIGDFGKFGDMFGSVEDIGMRSTRIRTLNRTVVSVPNANFASLNLENYSIRDKMLFNPTFQVKRSTTDEQLRDLIRAIETMLSARPEVEPSSSRARIVGLASESFSLEMFCYVLTADINDFYRIQGDLLLRLNEVFKALKVDLA